MMKKAALGKQGLKYNSNLKDLKATLTPDNYASGTVTDSFSAFIGGIYAKIGKLTGLIKPYYRPIESTKHGREKIHEWTKRYCAAHPDYRPQNPNFGVN